MKFAIEEFIKENARKRAEALKDILNPDGGLPSN